MDVVAAADRQLEFALNRRYGPGTRYQQSLFHLDTALLFLPRTRLIIVRCNIDCPNYTRSKTRPDFQQQRKQLDLHRIYGNRRSILSGMPVAVQLWPDARQA